MKQKELTKTFMMSSNLNKHFDLHNLYKINSALSMIIAIWNLFYYAIKIWK